MLEKRVRLDKLEIVGPYRVIQIRDAIEIFDDDELINTSSTRRLLEPIVRNTDGEMITNPLTTESDYVRDIAAVAWTDESKAAYVAFMDSQTPPV